MLHGRAIIVGPMAFLRVVITALLVASLAAVAMTFLFKRDIVLESPPTLYRLATRPAAAPAAAPTDVPRWWTANPSNVAILTYGMWRTFVKYGVHRNQKEFIVDAIGGADSFWNLGGEIDSDEYEEARELLKPVNVHLTGSHTSWYDPMRAGVGRRAAQHTEYGDVLCSGTDYGIGGHRHNLVGTHKKKFEHARWEQLYQAMLEHENLRGIEYDWVILTRSDLVLYYPLMADFFEMAFANPWCSNCIFGHVNRDQTGSPFYKYAWASRPLPYEFLVLHRRAAATFVGSALNTFSQCLSVGLLRRNSFEVSGVDHNKGGHYHQVGEETVGGHLAAKHGNVVRQADFPWQLVKNCSDPRFKPHWFCKEPYEGFRVCNDRCNTSRCGCFRGKIRVLSPPRMGKSSREFFECTERDTNNGYACPRTETDGAKGSSTPKPMESPRLAVCMWGSPRQVFGLPRDVAHAVKENIVDAASGGLGVDMFVHTCGDAEENLMAKFRSVFRRAPVRKLVIRPDPACLQAKQRDPLASPRGSAQIVRVSKPEVLELQGAKRCFRMLEDHEQMAGHTYTWVIALRASGLKQAPKTKLQAQQYYPKTTNDWVAMEVVAHQQVCVKQGRGCFSGFGVWSSTLSVMARKAAFVFFSAVETAARGVHVDNLKRHCPRKYMSKLGNGVLNVEDVCIFLYHLGQSGEHAGDV